MAKRFPSLTRDARPWALLGLGLALSVCLSGGVQAQSTAGGDALAPFEQTLFSRDYSGEPTASRLDRLESSVFGGPQSGSEAERQSRLVRSLSAAQGLIPKAPAGKANNADTNEPSASGISQYSAPGSPAGNDPNQDASPDNANGGSTLVHPAPPGDSDYPSVTALEREVFARDFVREDVAHRLDRLEKRTFGDASPDMALSDRVDRLMARYPNAASDVARYTRAASGGGSAETGISSALRDLPSDSSQFVGNMDTYTKVGALEKRFFNGKTYDKDLLTQRLDRLETKAYGHAYSGQGIDGRVNRLLSAYKVGPKRPPSTNGLMTQPDPAKWESPSTVGYTGSFLSPSQRGGSYGNASNSYAPPPSAAPPQNIQIGAGFSSSSTSASSYSPEMISMLPGNMQQQMAGSLIQQQSTTNMVGAPGTVITQQSTSYPGFQPYGGQPLQTYNYYGNPAVQSQTQSSTTVIQPDGSAVTGPTTYNTQTTTMPNNPYGLPTPAYVGDPTVLQNLGNLEINLYGQVDMMSPVAVRLARLETAMLHQVYPNYPDAQRVANLQRAFQVQSVGRMLGNGKAANIGRTAGSMLFGVPLGTPNAGGAPYNSAMPNYAPIMTMPAR